MFNKSLSLNSLLLLPLVNFMSGFRSKLLYISLIVSIRLSLTACATAIVHKNHFFRLYKQNKSSKSKVKFIQASTRCKIVLQAAKHAISNKAKESITSRKLCYRDSQQIANIVFNKDRSAIPPVFNGPEKLSCASDKAKLFAKLFSKNSNLDDLGISLPVFLSRTNLKLHNISVTPRMVKKVITNLDSSKLSGPVCIPKVLKNCEPEFSCILVEIFNMRLKKSCFPDFWKVSLVVPIFKNVGEKSGSGLLVSMQEKLGNLSGRI